MRFVRGVLRFPKKYTTNPSLSKDSGFFLGLKKSIEERERISNKIREILESEPSYVDLGFAYYIKDDKARERISDEIKNIRGRSSANKTSEHDPLLMPILGSVGTSLLAIYLGFEISEKVSDYYNIHNGFGELFLDSVSIVSSGIIGLLSGFKLGIYLEDKLDDIYTKKYCNEARKKHQ